MTKPTTTFLFQHPILFPDDPGYNELPPAARYYRLVALAYLLSEYPDQHQDIQAYVEEVEHQEDLVYFQ